jgi:hypothetical protein
LIDALGRGEIGLESLDRPAGFVPQALSSIDDFRLVSHDEHMKPVL